MLPTSTASAPGHASSRALSGRRSVSLLSHRCNRNILALAVRPRRHWCIKPSAPGDRFSAIRFSHDRPGQGRGAVFAPSASWLLKSLVSAVVIKPYGEHFTSELLQHTSESAGSNNEYAEDFIITTLLWLEGVYRCPDASASVAPLVVMPEILHCDTESDTRSIKRSGS